ncbi:hypothetical protein SEA_SOSHI_58 [Streptomyces phage Soshi]|uniref:Uncharacterized protein n=1 Tax=Streptomyces phage Soshi TaxID=2601694 RepID=A0A5J6DAA7_9CAUD|nr:hypothetical protein SEA_SOSHI_58 [Streptomyces phage Soshi]
MSVRLDEPYFEWLYRQVADPDIPEGPLTYWRLLRILFTTEFQVVVERDENRIEGGKALRLRFLEDQGLPVDEDPEWMEMGCSVLELMVRLAQDLEFEADGTVHYWFWTLMSNIGLEGYHDRRRLPRSFISNVLEDVIHRNYSPAGEGGFFPLRYPRTDQREVELWDQLSAYVLERGRAE